MDSEITLRSLLQNIAALDPEYYLLVDIVIRNLRGPNTNGWVDAYATAEPVRASPQKPPALAPAPVAGQVLTEKVLPRKVCETIQKRVSFFPEQDIIIGEVGSEGKAS